MRSGLKAILCAIDIAAVSVSVGSLPSRPTAATNKLLHASCVTFVIQPARMFDKVPKLAIVGVSLLLKPS